MRITCLFLLFGATLTRAVESRLPLSVESIRIGFGNTYKLGCWTPVEISLSGPPGQGRGVVVQAVDGDAVPVRFVDSTTSGGRVSTYAKIGRGDRPIEVLLSVGDDKQQELKTLRTLAAGELPRALPATNEFIVELGGSIGLVELAGRTKRDSSDPGRMEVVALDTLQRLPAEWYGYEGVDLVVIPGTAKALEFFDDPMSVAALEKWVRLGGRVLIAAGNETQSLLGSGRPLSRFAPGEFAGMGPLPPSKFGKIETYAGAEGKVERLNAPLLRVPLWNDIGGRIALRTGDAAADVPLVIRSALGFGEVIFVGLDLHASTFAEWPSRAQFLQNLLRRSLHGGHRESEVESRRGMQLGYADLSGQLRGALDQFDDVALIPFWVVAMLACAYVAILYPLNYWLAQRWIKRPQIAWLVFVLVAVAFSFGAYAVANRSKGDKLRVNQIDLVDFDLCDGSARGTTWFNLFSPTNAQFDLQVEDSRFRVQVAADSGRNQTPNSRALLGWLGLPGAGVGGMNSKAAGAPLFDQPYEIGAGQGRVARAPIGIWSSKAFVARWQAAAGGLETDLSQGAAGRLHGTISNRLNVPLGQCVLLFGDSAWPIGEFAADQTLRIEELDPQTEQQVDSYLTKRELYSTSSHTPPYDHMGFDVPRILEVMMFHDASGGENYSGLLHRQQRYVDLSSQLDFGRAILIGRAKQGAAVKINGEDVPPDAMNAHYSVFRYILPVKAR